MDNNELDSIWNDSLENIKLSVSPAIFSTWFQHTYLSEAKDTKGGIILEVACPSSFAKNTLETRYSGLVQDALSKSFEKQVDVIYIIKQRVNTESQQLESSPLFKNHGQKGDDFLRYLRSTNVRSRFTFKNYAVSSSNQMAWAAAEAVARSPGNAYNPLFIWGGVGVGKTHLMNAVGYSIIEDNNEAKVLFCTAENFTNDIVEGIRSKTTQSFREKYRKLDALLIDDIQFIAGKDTVQEEFFHTFNALVAAGSQIILTSDQPPSEISKLEERLRSRFEAGLIVDVAPPDFELRCAITQIKANEKNISMDMEAVQLIAGNIDAPRAIEGFLVKLTQHLLIHRDDMITTDLISSLLGKSDEIKPLKNINSNDILKAVCRHYSISKIALLSSNRAKIISRPRMIMMYLIRMETGMPFEEIGKFTGGKDHSTVMHAVNRITELASTDVKTREDIKGIKNLL